MNDFLGRKRLLRMLVALELRITPFPAATATTSTTTLTTAAAKLFSTATASAKFAATAATVLLIVTTTAATLTAGISSAVAVSFLITALVIVGRLLLRLGLLAAIALIFSGGSGSFVSLWQRGLRRFEIKFLNRRTLRLTGSGRWRDINGFGCWCRR
jgi:hypothetical protein